MGEVAARSCARDAELGSCQQQQGKAEAAGGEWRQRRAVKVPGDSVVEAEAVVWAAARSSEGVKVERARNRGCVCHYQPWPRSCSGSCFSGMRRSHVRRVCGPKPFWRV